MNHYLHYQRYKPVFGSDPIDMHLAETDMLLAQEPLHPMGHGMHPAINAAGQPFPLPPNPMGHGMHPPINAAGQPMFPPMPLDEFGAIEDEDVHSAAFGGLLGLLFVIALPFVLMASSGPPTYEAPPQQV